MAELIDYFKTPDGQVIPYALITTVGEVVNTSSSSRRTSWWFRVGMQMDASHTDIDGAKYYLARYKTEFEAIVMKKALEGRLKQYRRFYR